MTNEELMKATAEQAAAEQKAATDKAAADKTAAEEAAKNAPQGDKAGKEGAAGEEKKHEEAIPYSRFKEVNDELKALRDEKTANEKKAKDAEVEALKKRGEWETLAKSREAELVTAKQAIAERDIKQAVYLEAVADNAVDPAVIFTLLDRSRCKVLEDGTIVGVKEAVTQLLAQKPYLVAAGAPGYKMPAGGSGHDLTPEEIGKLSMAEYRKWVTEHPNA
jgi:hypothetical protein